MIDQADPTREGPPGFPIQLREAYLYEANVSRRPRQKGDARKPTLDAQIQGAAPDPRGGAFNVVLGANVTMPFGTPLVPGVAKFSCSIIGRFEHPEPLPEDFRERFCQKEALVLLWPYLRASLSELTRMAELSAPPLPTLDVSRIVAAEGALAVHSELRRPRIKKLRAPEDSTPAS